MRRRIGTIRPAGSFYGTFLAAKNVRGWGFSESIFTEGTITPCFVLSGGLGHLSGVFPKYRTSRRTSVSYFSPWRRKAQKSLERIRRTQLQHRNREPLPPCLTPIAHSPKNPSALKVGNQFGL